VFDVANATGYPPPCPNTAEYALVPEKIDPPVLDSTPTRTAPPVLFQAEYAMFVPTVDVNCVFAVVSEMFNLNPEVGELVPIPTLPLGSTRIRSELAVIMVIEPPLFVKYILLSDVEYSLKYAFALPETIASVGFVAAYIVSGDP
jgi:hypothetical protein